VAIFIFYERKRNSKDGYSKSNNTERVEMIDMSNKVTPDIPSKDIKIGKLIGRGAFGAVCISKVKILHNILI
jgi:hypothetical protein